VAKTKILKVILILPKVLIGLGICGLLYLIISPIVILSGPRHILNFEPYTTGEAIYYGIAWFLLQVSSFMMLAGCLSALTLLYSSKTKGDKQFYVLVGSVLELAVFEIWLLINWAWVQSKLFS